MSDLLPQSPPFTAEGAAGATVGTPGREIVLKQVVAVIDERTTMICLRAAGQIQPLHEPFDTLNGPFDEPPFHVHCRSQVVPWMPGMVSDQKRLANQEIMRRPAKQRRFGPEGYTGSLPPPPGEPPPVEGQWLGAGKAGVGKFPFTRADLRSWEAQWIKSCPSNTIKAAMDWQGRFVPDWIRTQFQGFGPFDTRNNSTFVIAYAHPVSMRIYPQTYVWDNLKYINGAWQTGIANHFYMAGSGTYGVPLAWQGVNGTISHEFGHIVWYGIHNGPFAAMPGLPQRSWLTASYQWITDLNLAGLSQMSRAAVMGTWSAEQVAFYQRVNLAYRHWTSLTRQANNALIDSVMRHVLPGTPLSEIVPVLDGESVVPFDVFLKNLRSDLPLDGLQRFQSAYSKYALQDAHEFIAECWSEFTTSPNPRPAALEVGTILQDMMLEGSKMVADWTPPGPGVLESLAQYGAVR